MKKLFIFSLCLVFSLCLCFSVCAQGKFESSKVYSGFDDVDLGSWYGASVKQVYELGIMDGVSDSNFDTEGKLSVAQCVTIASRLNSIYFENDIPEVQNSKNWYDKYVSYAIDNNIIDSDEFADYTRDIYSYEAVSLFSRAIPHDYFPAINNITEIPDVAPSLEYYPEVLMFYNAGILSGNDDYGFFYPTTPLTRKRASVIISNTVVKENRNATVELKPLNSLYTLNEVLDIINLMTQSSTLDEVHMLSVDNYSFSVAAYRNRYFLMKDNNKNDTLKEDTLMELKLLAGIRSVSDKFDVKLTSTELKKILESYYQMRLFYGDAYNNVLEANHTTDRSYAHESILSEFYSKSFEQVFGKDLPCGFTDKDVFDYANQNGYIRVKHILVLKETENAEEVAQEVLNKALAGEDFDALITQYGNDPGMASRPEGYFFGRGKMVKEFEDASYALEENTISGIVETDYGYHIIKRLPYTIEEFSNSSDFLEVEYLVNLKKGIDFYSNYASGATVKYAKTFDELYEFLE